MDLVMGSRRRGVEVILINVYYSSSVTGVEYVCDREQTGSDGLAR